MARLVFVKDSAAIWMIQVEGREVSFSEIATTCPLSVLTFWFSFNGILSLHAGHMTKHFMEM